MRAIKFRAIELPSAHVLGLGYKPKTVYGTGFLKDPVNTWLICNDEKQAIAFGQKQRIINPETVGQFTGLLDKNGKEIYEGDCKKHVGQTCIIEYVESKASFMWVLRVPGHDHEFIYSIDSYNDEVIGNIHENPELRNA